MAPANVAEMGFVALIFALLIEQGRPLPENNWVYRLLTRLSDAVMSATNAGERKYGVAGWLLVVGAVVGLLILAQWLLALVHPLATFCLHVAVLYLTVGFRQFSHAFTEIQLALAAGDVAGARRSLERWLREQDPSFPGGDGSVADLCRLAISNALVASHRHVFGPLFWYILLPGAVGPVLYRMSEMVARRWSRPGEVYGEFAGWAYRTLDWLPLRLSATGFAIVGNFEDAVYAWRGAVAAGTGADPRALLLAAGGGALGLRIADPELEARWSTSDAGYEWQGAEPGSDSLRGAVGLVWRSVVLWVALFALLTVAAWLGR
ncbi:MAG: CobD/CbiB family protein [Burkholderiaceae bacterium]|nr:MAG: CobD/CbiB family protein [Burkholderiaceae bacterium]